MSPYRKIKPYRKILNVSVGMSHHKLFCHVIAETRIIGLLRCLEHVDLYRYAVVKEIRSMNDI